jgi:DNA-binding MarR family transcriptional regulator
VIEPLDERELAGYFALVNAGDLVERAVAHQLREHGLTNVQFSVLARLMGAPDGRRMSDLADALVVSRSGLTYQISQLEKLGLIERSESAGDERGVIAKLTEAGRAKVTGALPGHVALVRESFLDLLDSDELATLQRVLSRVIERLGGPSA